MLSNATSTAWIDRHHRKGRHGEEDDHSRAVHTGSRQRGAGTKGRRKVDAHSRPRAAPRAGKSLAALTDPAHIREWAPFEADGGLATVGATVNLTWVGTGRPQVTTVTRADAPEVLEYGDIRWELEAFSGGTRLTLWHNIDRRFISWGAAGWHICFDVLDRLLSGTPIGRIAGGEAMKFGGWQRLNAEYAKQFGIETPNWPPQAAQKS